MATTKVSAVEKKKKTTGAVGKTVVKKAAAVVKKAAVVKQAAVAKKAAVAKRAAVVKKVAAKGKRARMRVPKGEGDLFRARSKKRIPFDMVLDELAPIGPETKPMFGCTAVYVEDKIVMMLRERTSHPHDNGVWLATTSEHHASLHKDFPSLRSVTVLGDGVTGWQLLPADAAEFEEDVRRACALVRRGDVRIGKVPASRRKR